MSSRTITVNLPEPLYERAKETAATSSLSMEEALTQFIALSLPALEDDLSPKIRSELAAMPLQSDAELCKIAKGAMDEKQQSLLEILAELKKKRALSEAEQADLEHLMNEAHAVMLRKAEAYRLLARRGYVVYRSSETPAD